MKVKHNQIKEAIDDCYLDHEHYTKYRLGIDETELKNSEATDKAVLTLSSASLAILLALSKDVNLESAKPYAYLLEMGWFVILLAMSCVLASMFVSGILHARHRKTVDSILTNRSNIILQLQQVNCIEGDEVEVDDKLEFEPVNYLSQFTRILHGVAPILLVLGIFSTGNFFLTHAKQGYEVYERDRKAYTNTTTTSSTSTTDKGGKIMSEQKQNNSVPPPSPVPKAPPPMPPSNNK